jgi:hypothetical protein
MQKEFIGDLNYGLVVYKDILLPYRIRVVLTDTKSTTGRRSPSCVLIFEVREERAKCVSLTATSGDDNSSISAAYLRTLDVDKLWLEAAETLALQYRAVDSDEVETATPKRGRIAAKMLADNVSQLSKRELMLIGFHYCNPLNRKSPTKAVQLAMGYGSRHTALRRIAEARRKGWVLPQGSTEAAIKTHFNKIQKEVSKT